MQNKDHQSILSCLDHCSSPWFPGWSPKVASKHRHYHYNLPNKKIDKEAETIRMKVIDENTKVSEENDEHMSTCSREQRRRKTTTRRRVITAMIKTAIPTMLKDHHSGGTIWYKSFLFFVIIVKERFITVVPDPRLY